jgi:hypothetical protein
MKADGSDQKFTGHPYSDTIAGEVVNATAVEIIEKKEGKVMFTNPETVSCDGNTLNEKFADNTEAKPGDRRG